MNCPSSKLTIHDLEHTANKLQKFALEVFAGNNERKKVQLLEGMENLMNPNSISIKRPIEVADIISEAKRIKLTASKLPNEIWMKIMSYLKNKDIFGSFAFVNKHFHNLTMDPSAVKYLHLEDVKGKAKSAVLYKNWMKVIMRSKTLVELKIKANYKDSLDWTSLIIETLYANQHLRSLKIGHGLTGQREIVRLTPRVVEALKLAKNLQHFQIDKDVELCPEILEVFCKLNSLKRLIISGSNGTKISPEFVESLAYSNNPIEYFSARAFWKSGDENTRTKALNTLFEKKQDTLKRISDEFRLKNSTSFGRCKNLEEFFGHLLDFNDLELISNMPKLKTLIIQYSEIDSDATYLKQFHHMKLSNLKYLNLKWIETNNHDEIFRELAKIPFPSLNTLCITTRNFGNYIPLTEKSVEELIKNIPSLKSLQLGHKIKKPLREEFIIRILREKNVIILLDQSSFYNPNPKCDKMILKKAGTFLSEKFKRMKNDCIEFDRNYITKLINGDFT